MDRFASGLLAGAVEGLAKVEGLLEGAVEQNASVNSGFQAQQGDELASYSVSEGLVGEQTTPHHG